MREDYMNWEGIILVGGTGQRMLPLTVSISKKLMMIGFPEYCFRRTLVSKLEMVGSKEED